jgi:hypothetical protein
MRIVNKDKTSKSEDKRISARLICRLPPNDPRPHSKPKQHDQNHSSYVAFATTPRNCRLRPRAFQKPVHLALRNRLRIKGCSGKQSAIQNQVILAQLQANCSRTGTVPSDPI